MERRPTTRGRSRDRSGPLRDGYGKIIKEDAMAKGMQRRAELEQLSGKSGSQR